LKKFLLIFSILILVTGIHAQDIKFMVGGSLSRYEISPEIYFESLPNEYSYEISYKAGFMIGGGIEFSLARNASLEIDALYLQKGTEARRIFSQSLIIPPLQIYTLHVINIPVLLKIRFLRGSSPYILGGHEWSLNLSHIYRERHFPDGHLGDRVSITDSTETLQSGLVYGGGFEIKLKKTSFFIEARFLNGLNNIIKDSQLDWETAKTRTIVVFAGFKI